MKSTAADWVLNQPWAITEEALSTILAIAERRNESPDAVEARTGKPLDNTHKVDVRDGVAIIPVVGPIARYADFFTEISGATAIETLAKDFRSSLDDRSVKAIILNMDSPGGAVAGVAEFAGHVREARGMGKPIVCYVGSRAQSAGYWIASAADQIVADPTAMLGSIGVVMGMRAKSGNERTIEFVSSQSPYKRVDPATETGKAQIQATTDDLADVFVDAVASNRDVGREQVLADFGQGGSLVGGKAVAVGMADGVGSLEQVIARLSRGEMPCPVKTPKKPAARKAEPQPRRAAMSEPNETISAAEAAELRKQLAEAVKAKADLEATATDRAAAIERDMADLKASNQRLVEAKVASDAALFVDSVTKGDGRKAYPAERKILLEGYQRAASLDARLGEAISFSDGEKTASGSYLDAFKASIAARPKIALNAEGIVSFDLDHEPPAKGGDDAAAREGRRKQNQEWKAQQGASVG